MCDKGINLKQVYKRRIFLSSVTDCYNPFEEKYKITRGILEELSMIDCDLSISTKSALILRDIDILKRFKRLTVSLSVNTLDENFKNDMDLASSITERLSALKALHDEGIKTVLFMSPIFPLITDFKVIVEKTADFISEYWFENLNLRGGYRGVILGYICNVYPDYYGMYKDIYVNGNKAYWTSYASDIEEYCGAHNIAYRNYFHHESLVRG
jgi:DNA repair photolyase